MKIQSTLPGHDITLLRILQYIVFGSLILYFGKEVFVPISFAMLISFVLYPVCTWLEKKGAGKMTAILLPMTVLILIVFLIVALLVYQFIGFLNEIPELQLKFNESIRDVSDMIVNVFGISREQQADWITRFSNQSGSSVLSFLRNTIAASAFSSVMAVLVPVYAVLILYNREYWMKILQRLFPKEDRSSLREVISLTIRTYYNFIKGMAIVYVIVGVLNSIGLLMLGIPHAILFGFIASVLTFVPYVGIMVGSLLPIAIAWITYDSIWYPVGIIGIFTFVQYLEANIIFPFAVSNRLNVNTFIMLVAIFVGGVLWGLTGMILFVPFVGIAKIIADHNPKWKTLSMVLGMDDSSKK